MYKKNCKSSRIQENITFNFLLFPYTPAKFLNSRFDKCLSDNSKNYLLKEVLHHPLILCHFFIIILLLKIYTLYHTISKLLPFHPTR